MHLKNLQGRCAGGRAASETCDFRAECAHVLADRDGIVRSRDGLLAMWAPAPGRSLFDCPALFGLKPHIDAIAHCRRELITDMKIGSRFDERPLDLIFERAGDGGLQLTICDASARQRRLAAMLQPEREALMARETVAPASDTPGDAGN